MNEEKKTKGTVSFYTLGCKVNQYETQSLRAAWQARGGVECDAPAPAETPLRPRVSKEVS